MDFAEFRQMLGIMASKMFRNPAKPEEVHPNPYQRMMEQLKVTDPEQYRKHLQPMKLSFNCQEKVPI
jgi:hypothetical protein